MKKGIQWEWGLAGLERGNSVLTRRELSTKVRVDPSPYTESAGREAKADLTMSNRREEQETQSR